MQQNTTQTGTPEGFPLPQTEVPQHELENKGSGGPADRLGGPADRLGGPQFNEAATSQPNDLFSSLEGSKTNGWGLGLFSWIRENKQLLLGVSGSLILAVIAITAIRSYVPSNVFPLEEQASGIVVATEGVIANDTISIDPATFLAGANVTTEAVTSGDGITHLARRAITARMQEQSLGLSPEQRIYAEDFVQNAIGTHGLNIGEKLSFPNQLVDRAITAAQSLTEAQLQNLSQYTVHVIF